MDTVIVGASEVAHLSNGDSENGRIDGQLMLNRDMHVTEDLAIHIRDGKIVKFSSNDEMKNEWGKPSKKSNEIKIIDADGCAIIPGFVDAHTHLLWDGDRSNEMAMKIQGMSYQDISNQGMGIASTVSSTQDARASKLRQIGISRLKRAREMGTTTLEAKSGYGLNLETELRMLQTASSMEGNGVTLHHTWLGAHAYPEGVKNDEEKREWDRHLIDEQLPAVIKQGIATSVDVFCEPPDWFSIETTEEICKNAQKNKLDIRLHVDEFIDGGGLNLAAEIGAKTADHAGFSSDDARAKASDAGVNTGFLPGTPYVHGDKISTIVNDCIENNWKWSLATDFNPNCRTLSIPFVGSLAVHRMRIQPIAALAAVTVNPASTLNVEKGVGQLVVGGVADLNILRTTSADGWCLMPGDNPVKKSYHHSEL